MARDDLPAGRSVHREPHAKALSRQTVARAHAFGLSGEAQSTAVGSVCGVSDGGEWDACCRCAVHTAEPHGCYDHDDGERDDPHEGINVVERDAALPT